MKKTVFLCLTTITILISLAGFASTENRQAMTIPQIVQAVANTVVEIDTQNIITGRTHQIMQPGAGSGVIISSDGYIVTNNHVIIGADGSLVDSITVQLRDGSTFEAEIVGRDERSDLAVIRIEAINLPVAQFGDSGQILVGELAIVIGNPLGNLGGTVTEGIISALNRDITIDGEAMNLLQTSAAVNPGNSGGGLFNAYGELVGIINAKPMGRGIEGIGFAIPSNQVQAITSQLIEHGVVLGRVAFNIETVDISDPFTAMLFGVRQQGLYVYRTHLESGLQGGDRIISINGTAVNNRTQVRSIYLNYAVGDTLEIAFVRGSQTHQTSVVLVQAMF